MANKSPERRKPKEEGWKRAFKAAAWMVGAIVGLEFLAGGKK
ncbi:MAG TPA: hypothetical protein VG992_02225 [Candidatus Saccharimonadales bacterium]|nr:hypothetical protein [Candidatus Saccharimonadales bacterium]